MDKMENGRRIKEGRKGWVVMVGKWHTANGDAAEVEDVLGAQV